jgi:hypothetical protein
MMDDSRYEYEQEVFLKSQLNDLNKFVGQYTPKGCLRKISDFKSHYTMTLDAFKNFQYDLEHYPEKVIHDPEIAEAIYHFYIKLTLEKEKQTLIKELRTEIKKEMNVQNKKIVEKF